MVPISPVTLEGHSVRLEPLSVEHEAGLAAAAADGQLWTLWYTSVPEPAGTRGYIDAALEGQQAGHMLPWAVRDLATSTIAGSTRYHDIVPTADRVEIGHTWYAQRCQRTRINTACKLLLLTHAFDTLNCARHGHLQHPRDRVARCEAPLGATIGASRSGMTCSIEASSKTDASAEDPLSQPR
jgi:N-acetyltransferase